MSSYPKANADARPGVEATLEVAVMRGVDFPHYELAANSNLCERCLAVAGPLVGVLIGAYIANRTQRKRGRPTLAAPKLRLPQPFAVLSSLGTSFAKCPESICPLRSARGLPCCASEPRSPWPLQTTQRWGILVSVFMARNCGTKSLDGAPSGVATRARAVQPLP